MKLQLFPDDDIRAVENKISVTYEPQTISEMDLHHVLLMKEARLRRRIFSWASWGALKCELKARIRGEKSLKFLLNSIEHVRTKEDALYFIRQAIPCILDLENRTLIKPFFMLLREGLANAQGKLHESTSFMSSMEERERAFIKQVSDVMNEEILGSIESKAKRKMPSETQ